MDFANKGNAMIEKHKDAQAVTPSGALADNDGGVK